MPQRFGLPHARLSVPDRANSWHRTSYVTMRRIQCSAIPPSVPRSPKGDTTELVIAENTLTDQRAAKVYVGSLPSGLAERNRLLP